ncbi:MAG TPA: c-type cytochrome [Kofleriaceae bacterium]|nr:c-type cytochrome [Kofleriaceae bacterium]
MKRIALLLLGACAGNAPTELPSPTPPPPWGVPISGGNLIITRDGTKAVIADPDRDRIMTVLLAKGTTTEIPLAAHSEPGRLVEDAAGRVHVALRGSGELLTLTSSGTERRAVCPEPRGVAYDGASDLLHVACTTGELVSLPAAGGPAVRTLHLDRDLRDVIVRGTDLVVTRFRSAEILTIDAAGTITSRQSPPMVHRLDAIDTDLPPQPDPIMPEQTKSDTPATVAWRTIALADGSILMSHQRRRTKELRVETGGYMDPTHCGDGMIESAITLMHPDGTLTAVAPMLHSTLPVDVAVNPAGTELTFVMAGTKTLSVLPVTALAAHDDDECGDPDDDDARASSLSDDLGIPTSVAYAPDGSRVIYYPELPALVIHPTQYLRPEDARTIRLPGPLGYDAGRALFHRQTGAHLACASCHPEGRDDGQVWAFAVGPRRTQNISGGVLARAPFHWNGDMYTLDQLMTEVFEGRMFGGVATHSERLSLGPWLDRIPAPRAHAITDADAVTRGEALFLAPEQACASCHMGENYTTNVLADVGTGGQFKVPSLVGVGARAPYMHDGCATTLRERFTPACGGGEAHGHTAQLTSAQIADLIAYLESL